MGKRIVLVTGIVLAVLIVFGLAAPWLFRDKLQVQAKKQLNERINARAGFKDVSISFFRHFPKVSLGLDEFFIIGKDQFNGDTLVAAKQIDIAINLFSLFGNGPVEIHQVSLIEPVIHALVDKNGAANWDILLADSSDDTNTKKSESFRLSLAKYTISQGQVSYDDRQSNMHFAINGLNHTGSGNFDEQEFRLQTETAIGTANFMYAGIPYLVNTSIKLDAGIDINTGENKYQFTNAHAVLNALKIDLDGFFRLVDDSTYSMDMKFNTPSNDFKSILSLVPALYKKDFDALDTRGTAAFNGFVKGIYSPRSIPAYEVNLQIKDGYFKYPDLPQPVQEITLSMKASNADGQPDNTILDIPSASLKFGQEPFRFSLLYKKPVSVQYIDAAANGKLDLASLGQFIKLPEGTRIGGQVNADLQAKGQLNVVLRQQPGPFQANGILELTNLMYASKEFPLPIKNTSATIRISNPDGIPDHTVADLSNGHAEIGTDKLDFSVHLTNPASDPNFKAGIKGGLELDRIKQWYSFAPGTKLDGRLDADLDFAGRKSMIDQKKYSLVQVTGQAIIRDLLFATTEYPEGLSLTHAQVDLNQQGIQVNGANGQFMQTNFSAKGRINNAIAYAVDDAPLSGQLVLNAGIINLNKWLGTNTSDTQDTGKNALPFAIPANINVQLTATAEELLYDRVKYEQVKGNLVLANETLTLQNLEMKALGGNIGLNGSYSTKLNKANPAITLAYSLNNLDVEQTFKAFNTVKYLMPVGEFIAGKLNSTLQLTGKLGETMMPNLNSLAGNGSLLLVEGFLSKFKPLEELAAKLNIPELQKISVKDIRQYFEFVHGKVLVKPFRVRVSDIDMEIGGMHGFDQSLDYIINMKIPRSRLGSQANQLVNGLAAELTKKGLPVSLGETINLKVNMGGSLTKPVISYNLQQASASLANEMEEKVKTIAAEQKAKADTLLAETKKAARDSLEAVKKQALKEAQDLIREQISGVKDSSKSGGTGVSTTKKAEDAAKGLLNNLLKKKKAPADSTGKKD